MPSSSGWGSITTCACRISSRGDARRPRSTRGAPAARSRPRGGGRGRPVGTARAHERRPPHGRLLRRRLHADLPGPTFPGRRLSARLPARTASASMPRASTTPWRPRRSSSTRSRAALRRRAVHPLHRGDHRAHGRRAVPDVRRRRPAKSTRRGPANHHFELYDDVHDGAAGARRAGVHVGVDLQLATAPRGVHWSISRCDGLCRARTSRRIRARLHEAAPAASSTAALGGGPVRRPRGDDGGRQPEGGRAGRARRRDARPCGCGAGAVRCARPAMCRSSGGCTSCLTLLWPEPSAR